MAVTFTATIQDASDQDDNAGDTALRDWSLDVDGDDDLAIDPDTGDAVFDVGAAAIVSDLKSRLLTFLGEWFLDTSIGFPWFQDVLGQKLDEGRIRSDVEREALGTPGVVDVSDLVITSPAAREVSVTFNATASTGQVIVATLQIQQAQEAA